MGTPGEGVEQAVEHEEAVEGLAEVQPAPLIGAIGVGQGAVGIQAVAQVPAHQAQAAGIQLAGGLDQDRLRLGAGGRPHGFGCAGDHRRMPEADLAAGEGLGGLRQLLQVAGDAHLLGGLPGGEPAVGAQPGGGAEGAGGGVGLGALEGPEGAAELGFQLVDALAEGQQAVGEGRAGQPLQVLLGEPRGERPELVQRILVRGDRHCINRTHVWRLAGARALLKHYFC